MNYNCSLCGNSAEGPIPVTLKDVYLDSFNSEMPTGIHVCYICIHLLVKFYKFKRMCLRAQSCLHASKENPVHRISTSKLLTLNLTDDHNKDFEIYQHGEENVISEEGTQHLENEIEEHHSDNNSLLEHEHENEDGVPDDGGSCAASEKTETFVRIEISLEEQRAQLDQKRREKKYLNAEYKCYNCALGFNYVESYQSHMVRHEESNGRYSCEVCGIRFASQSARCTHVAIHRTRYRCTQCDRLMTQRARMQHQCDTRSCFTCSYCGIVLKSSESLRQHVRRQHSGEGPRLHACNLCNRTYAHLQNLRVHLLKHVGVYPCEICGTQCSTPYALKRHAATHASRSGGPYCVKCDVVFVNERNYRQHLRLSKEHREIGVGHECMVCRAMFATRRDLARHVSRRHPMFAAQPPPPRHHRPLRLVPQTGHLCDTCGKCYKTRTVLKRHVKTHDNGKVEEKPA